MIRYLLYVLLAWFLYKLIFGFIIPVYKTTRQMKKQFRDMHDRMQQEQVKQEDFHQQSTGQRPASKPSGSDYIDFEEVK
jgi:uncharacterized protein YneF (UPF0154 family)